MLGLGVVGTITQLSRFLHSRRRFIFKLQRYGVERFTRDLKSMSRCHVTH